MKLLLMILGILITTPAFALDFEETLHQGQSAGSTGNIRTIQQNNLADIPNFNQAEINMINQNDLYQNPDSISNTAIQEFNSNPASLFMQESNSLRPEFIFSEADPLIQQADQYRQDVMNDYSACTTVEQCIEYGTLGIISDIQTCDKYLTVTDKTCTVELTGNASFANCFLPAQYVRIDRRRKDKIEVSMSTCNNNNQFNVTVDAYGGKGACNGPLSFMLPATDQADWLKMTTLQPHWNNKCRDVPVYYKGGCSNSCSSSDTPGCFDRCDFSFKFVNGGEEWIRDFSFDYSPARVVFNETGWVNNCRDYQSSCMQIANRCIASGVKIIDGFRINRPCWSYERTYTCRDGWIDNCQDQVSQGCGQISSICSAVDGSGNCTVYQNSYNCHTAETGCTNTRTVVSCNGEIRCLNPSDCFDTSNIPNQDFKNTVSQMSVLDEIGNDTDQTTMQIFSGTSYKCSKWIAGSKDCCDVNGILIDANVTGCSVTEEDLARNRDAGSCVQIGSYCDRSSFFGACLVKKESYCCFNSKLSRIVNEQGRPQIGKTWGTPKRPDCSGMTVEEIQQIDFSLIDFSEYYADINEVIPTAGGLSQNCSGCQ